MPRRTPEAINDAMLAQWAQCETQVWSLSWKWAGITGYDAEDLHSEAKARWFTQWHKTFDPAKGFQLSTYIHHACTRTFQRMANKWHRLEYFDPADHAEVESFYGEDWQIPEELSAEAKSMLGFLLRYPREIFTSFLDGRKALRQARESLQECGWGQQEIEHAFAEIRSTLL